MVRALVCPGQGAQSIGMGKSLAEEYSTAKAVFEEVDEALGEKLSNLIWEGDIALRGLKSEGFDLSSCSYLAGHSLGEYSALAMSKAISVSDAARLLRARGLAMQDAVPVGEGAMAAILGLNFETVQSLTNLAQAQAPGICQAANDNDPSQVVISGEKSAS